MACPICKMPHQTQQCMTFVTATQPLKDLLYAVHEQLSALVQSGNYGETWEAIYFNFYNPVDRNPLAPQDRQGWIWWYSRAMRHANRHANNRQVMQLLGTIRERIYMNLRPDRLESVWDILRPAFGLDLEIMEAKRCTPIQAANRYDTVVIYLTSNHATRRFLQRLKLMRAMSQLQDSDFRAMTPPGTGRVPDLPGVAVGAEPAGVGQESFGTQLCKAIAESWDQRCRIGPIPKWDFVGYALRHLLDKGIDVRRPWQVRL